MCGGATPRAAARRVPCRGAAAPPCHLTMQPAQALPPPPLPRPLQVASRIATAFTTFKKYDPARQVGGGQAAAAVDPCVPPLVRPLAPLLLLLLERCRCRCCCLAPAIAAALLLFPLRRCCCHRSCFSCWLAPPRPALPAGPHARTAAAHQGHRGAVGQRVRNRQQVPEGLNAQS